MTTVRGPIRSTNTITADGHADDQSTARARAVEGGACEADFPVRFDVVEVEGELVSLFHVCLPLPFGDVAIGGVVSDGGVEEVGSSAGAVVVAFDKLGSTHAVADALLVQHVILDVWDATVVKAAVETS
ncbi:hypothetical protein [Curtobacterium poinsettiae]|uniref:hypothetical protein n=1 Tax=Curtobacterium poinsettiae TaxID=159612 RepID=UPI00235FC860|nr:hypothetical protein [Curtobacterium flaccumfaciens]MDD1386827.1 hypothetical protein [Curtobacterium flaccumfaciens pv. poinsettiae]